MPNIEDELNMEEMTTEVPEATDYVTCEDAAVLSPEDPPPKPKRTRKKKTDSTDDSPTKVVPIQEETGDDAEAPVSPGPKAAPILTVEAGGTVETDEATADIAWHEIQNANRTRRILTGFLGGLEQTDAGKTLAILEYKGFRVVIPLKEMVLGMPNNLSGKAYADMILRQNKNLSNMLGCEIDFVIKGIDGKTRSIVASRTEAMLKKRKLFYFEPDDEGRCRVYPGRIIQARVIMVAEKAVRIEAFGAECTIKARDLSWDWIGDARDRFNVGDQILVRITEIQDDSLDALKIQAVAKSVSGNNRTT